MKNKSITNNLIYYLFCGFSGTIITLIIWLFLKAMSIGINFIWDFIPQKFEFKFYPIVICTIGGLILGIFQKCTKAVPDDLDTVMYKIKTENFYPYNNVILICISALLALIFGGSVGPEAGLTGVIAGLCYWAGDNMKYARKHIPDLTQLGLSTVLSAIFCSPLFGLIAPVEGDTDTDENSDIIKSTKTLSNIIAIIFSIGTLYLLNTLFGGSMGLPHIGVTNITNTERIWGIPLAILGMFCGLLFIVFERVTDITFSKLKKMGIILNTILGGIILGVAGTYIPFVMFSGEESITEIQMVYKEYAPWLLITSGVLKLLITNICIKSGWKGGHFFPVIFCGVIIGYGIGMLFGINLAFCAALITAGLLGATMKKPLAVTLLLLLCFDVSIIPWILIAAFIGSLIPTKKPKTEDTSNEKQ